MEEITILKVGTKEAVKNIEDLKNNIKILKKELEGYDVVVDGQKKHIAGLNIGTEEYKNTLKELETNQAALKNAMHGTATSMEQIAAAAKGQDQSYNGLVRTMAQYKEELRAIDISTEEGKKAFEDKAAQIKEVNDQLKELDALQGNFQRNVGNYEGALESWWSKLGGVSELLKSLPPSLGSMKDKMGQVGETIGFIGNQPLLGMLTLLGPIISNITSGLQENQTALDAIDKVMKALQPVMDFFSGILQRIAEYLSKAVDYILNLAEESGISFKKIVSGAVGVGNAILQFLLVPIRNVIDGAKSLGKVFQSVFKGQFKQAAQDAKQAVKDIGENFKKGFDFKGNFEAGKKVGEQFINGLKSTKKKAGDAAAEVAKEVENKLLDVQKRLQAREGYEDWVEGLASEAAKEIDEEFATLTEGLEEMLNEYDEAQWKLIEDERKAAEEEKALQEQRLANFTTYSDTLGNVFSTLADIYESDSEADEEAAKKAKALRTAAAIVSTISGAVGAFMSTWKAEELPLTAKYILAPANAASVLAAGYAQVKAMNAVQVGNSAGASVSAPSFNPEIPKVQNITGQNEQKQAQKNNRVYLVYSDLQVANTNQRVKVQETEF